MTEPKAQIAYADAERVDRVGTRLLKVMLALLFLPPLELWRSSRRLLSRSRSPMAVVVYYHRILSGERARFGRQMDMLLRWSTLIRASDEPPLSSRAVLVTFDDGWQSFCEVALPELEARQIPTLIFLISGRLEQTLETGCPERLLTEDEVRTVARDLVTIGSHSDSHVKMPGLPELATRYELRSSREKLSQITGRDVNLFCFPFGAADPESVRLCREEGYIRAFTGIPGFFWPNKFATGRVRVDPSDWTIEYFLKIVGAYSWMAGAIAAKSRIRSSFATLLQTPKLRLQR